MEEGSDSNMSLEETMSLVEKQQNKAIVARLFRLQLLRIQQSKQTVCGM